MSYLHAGITAAVGISMLVLGVAGAIIATRRDFGKKLEDAMKGVITESHCKQCSTNIRDNHTQLRKDTKEDVRELKLSISGVHSRLDTASSKLDKIIGKLEA